ncbi:MAG: enoyl-CoA hydratase-related protein [Bradyrhizobium sp.]
MKEYDDIIVTVDGAVLTVVINRPDSGNKLRAQTCTELLVVLQNFRLDSTLRAMVLTGVGEKFFCIGGEHDELLSLDQSQVLPMIDLYQQIDTIAKPIIAAVNGYAVGGGNVLHTVCDLTVAADNAIFRQVGPLVGSYDAGYGTWYLEDTIGRKRAKEMWLLNRKYSAQKACEIGLVNEVVPAAELLVYSQDLAKEISQKSPLALGALKSAFSARHNGVSGQARMAHDQLLTMYLRTDEAHEVSVSFAERRAPDSSVFWH